MLKKFYTSQYDTAYRARNTLCEINSFNLGLSDKNKFIQHRISADTTTTFNLYCSLHAQMKRADGYDLPIRLKYSGYLFTLSKILLNTSLASYVKKVVHAYLELQPWLNKSTLRIISNRHPDFSTVITGGSQTLVRQKPTNDCLNGPRVSSLPVAEQHDGAHFH